ncbi:short-chain dehydrogenase/reductase SDR [Cordyceps fumosorosea ARSEF 2679]|uniref:Short-chain dehydrogenase/reductase SDR n=1 Tax=Cordyceps fumosorosea (strain ARSEF 2679) TaxID=1081104 RepID=A0A168BKR3_CORFA|nr:short-chain dehydrogenase/reductase SDR [Cordyceps fumosorosea ARSEF 2679]OAA70238.1 short-chain dehydrogenase/reductase SDR [Cordyceps fumosorosea ARSEF 2679]
MTEHSRFATYPSLRDRVVVITGGSMGIGASMVEHFSVQGSQVIFLDIDDDAAAATIARVAGLGVAHEPVYHHCDVSDIAGALQPTAAAILSAFPRIDCLVNSAAAGMRKPTADITPEWWAKAVDVNLSHHFFLTQALQPGLERAGAASVVNMGSISWAIPATGLAPYTTMKAAVVGLTRTLAHELGPRGIRVNSIMPGSIATERELREVMTPEYEQLVLRSQALKRLLVPAEVARTALWLCADDSSGMTNQSIRVDAGWT